MLYGIFLFQCFFALHNLCTQQYLRVGKYFFIYSHLQRFPPNNLLSLFITVRTGLNRDLGFSPGDRAESVRRVGEMACLFSGGGVITLVTLVSPYRADRDAARARHEAQGIPFLEVVMDGAYILRIG